MNRLALRTVVLPSLPTSRRRTRAGLAATGVVVTLAALAGCSAMSPAQTLVPYQPADGVALNSGVVKARDLLVVASDKGQTGVLSGSLINTGATSVTVSFAAGTTSEATTSATSGSSSTTVELGPREQKRIETVTIPDVAAPPGSLVSIIMTTPAGDTRAEVPVLLPTGYYATLTPTAGTSATDDATTTPDVTATTTAG